MYAFSVGVQCRRSVWAFSVGVQCGRSVWTLSGCGSKNVFALCFTGQNANVEQTAAE